jgi:prepilin-type N-terminal cleavage/methylation domain-containing protein
MNRRTRLKTMHDLSAFTSGFTLLELLMVIAIMGITLAIAIPNFKTLITSIRLTNAANNMVSALQIAKSEAIKSNSPVSIIPNLKWENGWDVKKQITNEPPISKFERLNDGYTVQPKIPPISDIITYRPDGRIITPNNEVVFYFCSPASTAAFREVTINATGRVKVVNPNTNTYSVACPA